MMAGAAAQRELADEERALALGMKDAVLEKIGGAKQAFDQFEVDPLCLSQVVAGTNFFFKYNVGNHESGPFVFARVVSLTIAG